MTGHGHVSAAASRSVRTSASTGCLRASTSSSSAPDVELEHGARDLTTDVTGDDPVPHGQDALA